MGDGVRGPGEGMLTGGTPVWIFKTLAPYLALGGGWGGGTVHPSMECMPPL